MFLKGCLVPSSANTFFALFWPSFALSICYFLWINTFWGLNVIYLEVEYNIVLLSLLSIALNVVIFLTGFFSKNKYALLGSVRTLVVFFGMELIFGLFFLIIVCCAHSFNLAKLAHMQVEYPLLAAHSPICTFILVLTMLEISKSPFDLNEAETELVTGYHTEYGAFFFALFYLGEYFHLFFSSLLMVYLFIGF